MRRFGQMPVLSLIAAILLAPGCGKRSDEASALSLLEDREIRVRVEGLTSSPDGKQLAFAVYQESPFIGVFSVDDSSTQTFPAQGRLETWYGLSWGPNGDFLVATVAGDSLDDSLHAPFRIWKLNLADGQWTKVAESDDDICQRAVVSPNGDKLVFRAAIEKDLYIVDLHTGTKERLMESGDINRLGFAWAPDGTSLYYSRNDENGEPGIWQINVDERKPKSVVNGVYCPALAVSRSGRYLAYVSEAPDGSRRLYVASSDGSDPYAIGDDRDIIFSWCAGQDWIASTSNGRLDVWDAGRQKAILIDWAEDGGKSYPAWLDGSRTIAVVYNETELWIHDFDTKTQRKVFAIEDE